MMEINMYQAIVFKIKTEYAIVLTKDSEYKRIKRKKNMLVGQQIYFVDDDLYNHTGEHRLIKYSSLLATLAIIFVTLIALPQLNSGELYAVISLDINPSFNMTIDEDHNVLELIPLNASGRTLYDGKYIGKLYVDVIDDLIVDADEHNFLNDSNNIVLISASSEGKTNQLKEEIIAHITDHLETDTNSKVIFVDSDWNEAIVSLDNNNSIGRSTIHRLANAPSESTFTTQQILEIADINDSIVFVDDLTDRTLLNNNIEILQNMNLSSDLVDDFIESINEKDNQDIEALAKESERILQHQVIYNETQNLIDELKSLDAESENIIEFVSDAQYILSSGSYEKISELKLEVENQIISEQNRRNIRNLVLNRLNEALIDLNEYSKDDRVITFIDSLNYDLSNIELNKFVDQAESLINQLKNEDNEKPDNYGQNKKDDDSIENPGQSNKDDQSDKKDDSSNDNNGQNNKDDNSIENPSQSDKDDQSDKEDDSSNDNNGQNNKDDESIENPSQSDKDDPSDNEEGSSNDNYGQDKKDDNSIENPSQSDKDDQSDKEDDSSNDNYGQDKKDDDSIENPGQSDKDDPSDNEEGSSNDNYGQDKKDDDSIENPGQSDKDDPSDNEEGSSNDNYGQNKKDDDSVENPSQSNKNENPGQSKKSKDD